MGRAAMSRVGGRSAVVALAVVALVGSGCGSLWIWRELPVDTRPAPIVIVMGASDVPHVSVFYDALADYGTWVLDDDHGWVWVPSDPTYVPYTRGAWVETEVGPTWLGDEPYGWAVDHYGRWEWSGAPEQGRWRWVPTTGWGPAWVEWRIGDGVVGWAPRAPDGGQRGRVATAPAEAWQFVAEGDFWTRDVGTRVYRQAYAGYFLIRSRPPTGPVPAVRGAVGARTQLSGLPAERIRWLPAWARLAPSKLMPGTRGSVRAAPARPQRFDRAGPARWPRPPHHRR